MTFKRFAAVVFLVQGTFPLLLWTTVLHGASRWFFLVVFSVYVGLAVGIWLGYRLPIFFAIGISALQSFGFSTQVLSWRFYVGPALEIAIAPVAGPIANWCIIIRRSVGVALNYSLGHPCPPIQDLLRVEGRVFWVNLVAMSVCTLLILAWDRG